MLRISVTPPGAVEDFGAKESADSALDARHCKNGCRQGYFLWGRARNVRESERVSRQRILTNTIDAVTDTWNYFRDRSKILGTSVDYNFGEGRIEEFAL